MEREAGHTGQLTTTSASAFGTSSAGGIRFPVAGPDDFPVTWSLGSSGFWRWTTVVRLTVKPVGKPDAGNPHVRFDERGWETELYYRAHPRLYALSGTASCLGVRQRQPKSGG